MKTDYRKAAKSILKATELCAGKEYRLYGFLGRSDGTIVVSDRANYVYVRTQNDDEIEAFNDAVSTKRSGLGVVVSFSKARPYWHITDVWQPYGDPVPRGLREHADTHGPFGPDPLWVWPEQYMAWAVMPIGAFTVRVFRRAALDDDGLIHAPGYEDLDLSSHKPTTGARYALIELRKDGTLNVVNGSVVGSRYGLVDLSKIPAATSGALRLCAVALYVGQSALTWTPDFTDFVDLRGCDYGSGGGGGTGDMEKSVYDTNDDGIVNAADTAANADHATAADSATTAGTADSANAVRGKAIDPTLDPADGETLVWDAVAEQFVAGSAGGGVAYYVDQAGGTGDTYGALSGSIDGSNTTFTVSQGAYDTGTLVVTLNGQVQIQGSGQDWSETDAAVGTFDFAIAPVSGDKLLVMYQNGGGGGGGGGGGVWGEITGDISTQADLMARLPVTPDTPPGAPDDMDDEFSGTGLDTKWTEWNKQSGQVIEVSDGWLSMKSVKTLGTAPICAVIQPAPSGTWKVRAKLCIEAPTWNYVGVGLVARRTTGADKTVFGGVLWNSSYGTPSFFCGRVNGTSLSTETDCYNINTNPLYLELEYDGTNLIWRVSSSGWKFAQAYAETAANHLGGAPEYVGIDLWAYADGSDNQGLLVSADWFRRIS